MKSTKRSPIKLLLAFILLAALLYFVGAKELIHVFKGIQPRFIAALIGISFVLIGLSCIKWRLFIRAWGHDAPLWHLMRIYTITYFYNVFAPSFLLGDLARSYHLGRDLENQKDAFVATFLERFTGLLAMVILATVFVALGAKATSGLEAAILLVTMAVILAAFICFSKKAYDFFVHLGLKILRLFGFKKITERLETLANEVSRAIDVARNNQALFFKAMFWSVCFHFGTVINTYTAARAIGWQDPDFGGLCIVVPLVLLVAIAPLTPSGIGIQEGAFMFLLQRVGATPAQALSVGLVIRAKNLITALVGWLLWLTLKQDKKSSR